MVTHAYSTWLVPCPPPRTGHQRGAQAQCPPVSQSQSPPPFLLPLFLSLSILPSFSLPLPFCLPSFLSPSFKYPFFPLPFPEVPFSFLPHLRGSFLLPVFFLYLSSSFSFIPHFLSTFPFPSLSLPLFVNSLNLFIPSLLSLSPFIFPFLSPLPFHVFPFLSFLNPSSLLFSFSFPFPLLLFFPSSFPSILLYLSPLPFLFLPSSLLSHSLNPFFLLFSSFSFPLLFLSFPSLFLLFSSPFFFLSFPSFPLVFPGELSWLSWWDVGAVCTSVRWGWSRGYSHVRYNVGMCCANGLIFHKKSLHMAIFVNKILKNGSHFTKFAKSSWIRQMLVWKTLTSGSQTRNLCTHKQLRGYFTPNQKLACFCALSQNY